MTRSRNLIRYMFLAACVACMSCEGKAGPMGPQGPAGLPGPAGPGTRLVVTGTIDASGGVSVALPAAAGTSFSNPPSIACYNELPSSPTVWLAVASTPSTSYPFCGLVFSGGVFDAVMSGAAVGSTAAFVIVY